MKATVNGKSYPLVRYKGITIAPVSLERVLVANYRPIDKVCADLDSKIDVYVNDVHMKEKPKQLYEKIRRNEI